MISWLLNIPQISLTMLVQLESASGGEKLKACVATMAMLVVAGLSGCAVVEQTAVPPAVPESGVANFSSAPAGGE